MRHEAFFGTDGIRDEFGKGRLSAENLGRIGRALGAFARGVAKGARPRVFVGRDTRESGPALLSGIAAGLAAEGALAEDGGVMPTPAIAWWATTGACDLAVALTASHNPAEFNGVKVFLPGGRKTAPDEEEGLDRAIRAAKETSKGAVAIAPRKDALPAYLDAAVRWLETGGRLDGLRLVVDCANGATRETAPAVLSRLGAVVLCAEVEGRAINQGCGTENPAAWIDAVRRARVDGGLAFDGDGDRVLLCDADGRILDGDPLLHLLALEFKARSALPGNLVVGTVMANMGLETALLSNGIRLERTPVGDRYVAERMRETGAALGGEQSGHVVLKWGDALIGDGLVAGVRALQAARSRGLSLAAARDATPKYPQVLKNVRVARKVPLDETLAFSAAVKREEAALAGSGRVVVRYSGTEPLLRIMVEAKDRAVVDDVVARLVEESRTLA